MKLFAVSIEVHTVIAAEDENDAFTRAYTDAKEMLRETRKSDMDINIDWEIKHLGMLPDGWDKGCFPYGADDEKRISDYIGDAV